jgi:hypothetical protein
MALRARASAVLTAAWVAIGCAGSSSEPETAQAPEKAGAVDEGPAAEELETPGFKRIEERSLGFSVLVPEDAEKKKVERDGVAPGAWMWLGQTEEGSVYTVAYFGDLELDPANLDDQLAQAVVGIVQGCRGRVINAKRGGASWGEMVVFAGVCAEGEPVIGRLHIQRSRMYAVFAIAKSPAARDTVRAFLSSFREVQ